MGTNGDGDIQIAFCQMVVYLQRLIDGGNDAADEDDAKPGGSHHACHHGHGLWHLFVLGGSSCHFITCLSKINSGKLAATVLMQNASVVPMGKPLTIRLSITGITPVALE